MQTSIEKYLDKIKFNKDILRVRAAAAVLLSILVITGVFWWLKIVGITMAGDAFCGMEEHTHTAECEMIKTLICDNVEADHIHNDKCYEITYSCGLVEHSHTSECYSNSAADVENEAAWKKSFADVDRKLIFTDDLIAIAKSQLGYKESTKNFKTDANGVKRGITRYGQWYGNPYGEWSAMFVSFCLNYTVDENENLPLNSGVEAMRTQWEDLGIYKPIADRTPEQGDILFKDENGDGKADFVGIITEVEKDSYKVIAGDIDDKVSEITVSKTDEKILGATVAKQILELLVDEETVEVINYLTGVVSAFPSMEEIVNKVGEFDDADDIDGLSDYLGSLTKDTRKAYNLYRDIGIFGALVPMGESLTQYSSLWTSYIDLTSELTIHHINQYHYANSTDGNILIHSGSVGEYTLGMSFRLCSVYFIAVDSSGYYVKSAHPADGNTDWRASVAPDKGFILILNESAGQALDVKVGDRIEIDFVFKDVKGSKAAGYGTVYKMPNKNNLTPIQAVDTSEFITLNLYNYGSSINSKYNSNHNYPGFQQAGGTTVLYNSFSSGSFNFGDNITTEQNAGHNNITPTGNGAGAGIYAINKTVNKANTPIQGAMNYNLVDGYPALKYTASGFDSSLKWLFSDNAATTTTKVNSSNINGLFLYDEDSGYYYFDSRLNHAEYNTTTGNFDLYSEHLTPNYAMYPFGNFLPFNSINTQATKVTSITKDYYTKQISSALVKYQNGLGDAYNTLSEMLSTFSDKMGTSFNYQSVANKYFSLVNEIPSTVPSETFNGMYNLDFDEPSDFYFGMDMHMNFMMTKNGMTGSNSDVPLYFDFNGDDDVWVYVDGKLFLDLSGIHRHVGGRIDFQHGRVEYYQFNPATGQADISVNTNLLDANGNEYKYTKIVNGEEKTIYYVPFSVLLGDKAAELINPETGTFYEYTNHTFDFYYMERGSGSSVCRMEFTLPLLKQNGISVTKQIDSKDDITVIGNPDFSFQILNENGTAPFIGEGVEYSIMNADTQTEIGKGVTGVNGVFSIKAGQTAVFTGIQEDAGKYFVRELLDTTVFEQYGTVTVDGKTVTRIGENDVLVGEGSFKGVDSGLKDISDGTTAFAFTNHVDITKYGALVIAKQFNDYMAGAPPRDVTFEVTIGGVPIPVGTKYQVVNAQGLSIDKEITAEGVVTFNSAETLVFSRILAGTKITLRETSPTGYDVTYSGDDSFVSKMVTDGDITYCEVLIPSGVANLSVINDREGTKLAIPVDKTLLYSDGVTHTYTFAIQQIIGLNDLTAVTDGVYIEYPITISEGTSHFDFKLNFPPGTPADKYYYLVYEKDATVHNGMDLSRYIAEVTVTTEGGKVLAEITGYYSDDGVAISGENPFTFTNKVVRQLTINKTVTDVQSNDLFTFNLTAGVNGTLLEGTFALTGNSEFSTVTFTNGVAQVKLRHGQTVTINGLPYGTQWSVTEAEAPGYNTTYLDANGDAVKGNSLSGTLNENGSVHFYNRGGPELPSTGSAQHLNLTVAGITLMLLSLVLGYVLRHRKERRSF